MPALEVPSGFLPWAARGPFVDAIADMFVAVGPAQPVFGVRVKPTHCNGQGAAHGGFLSTLADVWSAYCLAHQLAPEARFATSSLAVEFLSRAQAGDWLQSVVDRVRVGRRSCVVTLAIMRDQHLVVMSRASFALVAMGETAR